MLLDELRGVEGVDFRQGATPDVIDAAEQSFGQALPQELKDLLAESDGIEDEYGTEVPWTAERIGSTTAEFRASQDFADLYMPFDGLVFFGDPGNGDQFFVSLSGNQEVYLWDHENDSRTWVAESVLACIEAFVSGDLDV